MRVGIIGFGRIGAQHADWLSRSEKVRAVAAADPTPPRLTLARQRGLAVYPDLLAMLTDDSIDAVLVATPTSMHCEHALAALRAGRHVMVEKPMAMDLSQARQMQQAAASAARVLSVFHNRRWDADYLAVCQAVRYGVAGKIFNVENRLGQWASCVGPAAREYRPGWRNESAYGGGGLFDWGSHFVDQLWRMMLPARPLRLFAQLRGNVWSTDCDDFARICIDFDNGAVGLVEINTTTTHPLPRWHIDGSAGSISSPPSLQFDVSKWAELDFVPAEGGSPRRLPRAPAGLSEEQIWDRFAAAAAGNGEPAVSAESVLITMAILDAARESSRRGTVIDLAGISSAS
jgi:scyllo-inositol 2-dehydrogenase (NADP+)